MTGDHALTLSLVIPAYNEAARLPKTLRAALQFMDEQGLASELIVVDDGSTDGTRQCVEAVRRADRRVSVLCLGQNQGKGAAVAAGVERSRGRFVAFLDADLSYDLGFLCPALDHLERGADLVIGGRDLAPKDTRAEYRVSRQWATRVFNALVESLLTLGVADTQCGFKVFRREVAVALFRALRVKRFGFDVELIFLARHWNLELVRLPVVMADVAGSSVRLGRDSVQMLRDITRVWWRRRLGSYPSEMPRFP